ncbi:CNNM domain-containing protein [Euryarchaeota archaeon]|nr:CNNM domain-containing protein [Euryarchaeota archaeon]MDC3281997.1 CNNM domain-containing protein [Euryarchaeota archaeon]
MDPTTLIIFYGTLALGASFLCSILEAVLLSTTHGHIVALKDTHPKISVTWSNFKDDPEGPLTAILTLNTIAHTVGALGVGHQVEKAWPEVSYIVPVSAAVLTIAILLLSEILPKTIGALYWRKLTVSSARVLGLLMFILLPIVYPIEKIRSLFPAIHNEAVTRDELSHLADIAEETQVIERDEEKVIQNLLGLREKTVASIMTPRVVMETASSNETVSQILERIPIMVHGRLPVTTNQNIDEIEGMVLRSDILREAAADNDNILMNEISRDIHPCRDIDSVDKALDILLDNKEQILIVKDEFGGTVGLVTMEDIIETLLGVEIVDEDDQDAIEEGNHHEDMRELAKIRQEVNDAAEE